MCWHAIPGALVACVLQLGSFDAWASTFTVNDSHDAADVNPGDGICITAGGKCTLRAAIQESNAHAGTDAIVLQAGVTYTLTLAGVEDAAASGDLDILDSVDISVAAGGNATIDANQPDFGERVFDIFHCTGGADPCDAAHPAVEVTMTGLTIQHGTASDIGGGIRNSGSLTLTHCVVADNIGSGIYNDNALILDNTTVSGNLTVAGNAYGAGIFNIGSVTLENSTVSNNKTTDASNTFGSPGLGGGIYTSTQGLYAIGSTISGNTSVAGGGVYNASGQLTLLNTTISGNSSTGGGGGIYSAAGATLLFNATITGNMANSDSSGGGIGGGVANANGSSFTFRNSIIALNTSILKTGAGAILINDDCTGSISAQANNIMYMPGASCTPSGPIVYADPNIGPLQFNGGPTQTHALLPGSMAIDTGEAGGCTVSVDQVTVDQRGYPRPSGAGCDIGSFEVQDTVFKNGFEAPVAQ